MCGLFSFYSNQRQFNTGKIAGILASLQHRGPDAHSYWHNKNKKVVLAHTRLSIVDLESVHYPVTNEDGSIQLILNGEFYDYKKIRRELITQGHIFKTNTDAEILVHLYEEKGIQALHDLRGEFAFILWDQNNELLFAARDRFGVKPLYYAHHADSLYFASEIQTLFSAGIMPKWDQQALWHYLHFNLGVADTLFQGIQQLPPGHYFMAHKNDYKIIRYWETFFPSVNETTNSLSETEYIEQVRNLLLEGVRLRLDADVPVGVYLSGGIDSAALLGIASYLQKKQLTAFSISFIDSAVDEAEFAKISAKFTNTDLRCLAINDEMLLDNFYDAVVQATSPMGNSAGIARYLLSKFTQEAGYKVVLSGEGSDELFLGYNYMRIEALENSAYHDSIPDVAAFIAKMNALFPVDRTNKALVPEGINLVKKTIGYIPRWLRSQAILNAKHRFLVSKQVHETYKNQNPYAYYLSALPLFEQLNEREPVIKSCYLWLKTFFPNNLLNWVGDRAEMAHGIEARQPFLDHHLFEMVKKIPINFKIKGKIEKYILREAVKDFIAPEIYQREKFMFQAPPFNPAKSKRHFDLFADWIMTELIKTPFYDANEIEKFIAEMKQNTCADKTTLMSNGLTFMTLASIAVLQNKFGLSM